MEDPTREPIMTSQEIEDWISTLKVGDKVAVINRSFGEIVTIGYTTVLRFTPTGRVVAKFFNRDIQFHRDGRSVGKRDIGSITTVEPRSEYYTNWMRRVKYTRIIRDANLANIPVDVLEQIALLLD